MEIREPFDPETEKKWKESRREKLKEIKRKEREEAKHTKDDDEYWKRLDELEVILKNNGGQESLRHCHSLRGNLLLFFLKVQHRKPKQL